MERDEGQEIRRKIGAVMEEGTAVQEAGVKKRPLCGGLLLLGRLRLQTMQVIRSALRMGSGAKDQPLIVLQCIEPMSDVGGMIVRTSGVIVRSVRRNAEPSWAINSSRA